VDLWKPQHSGADSRVDDGRLPPTPLAWPCDELDDEAPVFGAKERLVAPTRKSEIQIHPRKGSSRASWRIDEQMCRMCDIWRATGGLSTASCQSRGTSRLTGGCPRVNRRMFLIGLPFDIRPGIVSINLARQQHTLRAAEGETYVCRHYCTQS